MSYIDIATWGWPQATYLFLVAVGLGATPAKVSRSGGDMWDFFGSIFSTLAVLTILYYGRFFG